MRKHNVFKIAAILLFHWSHESICFRQAFHCPFAKLSKNVHLNYATASVSSKDGSGRVEMSNNILKSEPGVRHPLHLTKSRLQTDFSKQDNGPVNSKISFNGSHHQCAAQPASCFKDESNQYFRSMDGSCNNIHFPGYGMALSRYTRFIAPKYGNGVNSPTLSVTGGPLPSPRLLSMVLYGEQTLGDHYRTMASMQWGQLVGHDISKMITADAPDDCCSSAQDQRCFPIILQPFGPISTAPKKSCMHFVRSASDEDLRCPKSGLSYAEKITTVTGYLDLSSIYGNSLQQSRRVRQFRGGLLRTNRLNNQQLLPVSSNADGECGRDISQCFSMPDTRNQIVPTLIILHTILVREHNRIAAVLERMNPHFTDERLYQEARKLNIAQYQKITYYDWLPLIIGPTYARRHGLIHNVASQDYVRDYDAMVNAAPFAEFSSAAFRYLHHQIPGWFSLVDSHKNQTLRLSDFMDRPESVDLVAGNFNSVIRGMLMQLQKRLDGNVDKEIKHFFARKAFEQFGSDLKAIDIQRARDFGMPSYNSFREYCGLSRAKDWSDFLPEISPEKVGLLKQLYASPNDVELSVGGSFEIHAPQSLLGPTFQCIIGRQFLKTRTGDRFFFERENRLSGFTREQLHEVRKASLSGLICNNVAHIKSIQLNAFIFPVARNIRQSCAKIPQVNLDKWSHISRR